MLWCSSSQTVSLPEVSHSSPQKSPFVSGSITIFIADPPWPAPWGPPGPPVAPGGGRCFLVGTLGSFWSRNGILQTRGWPGIPTEKLGTTNKMVMDCFTCWGDCGSIIIIYIYIYICIYVCNQQRWDCMKMRCLGPILWSLQWEKLRTMKFGGSLWNQVNHWTPQA